MTAPRIVVALDYPDEATALAFARRVSPGVCRMKVGLELFTAAGPALIGKLADLGYDVFLDLKFHDIPNTVARACQSAARLGVWMMNVHALGGLDMMRAAREAIAGEPRRPLLVGVTLLTSHDAGDIAEIGLRPEPESEVQRLAGLVHTAGLDGVVCSPRETSVLRAERGKHFVLVTPGVRPAGSASDDQQRTLTPAEAIRQGADYLVIGRPVTRAPDPIQTLEAIRAEIGETADAPSLARGPRLDPIDER
jgi:orotidine-5'-phosphate decarboxylase